MPPSSWRGICSVSRKLVSGSYSTTAVRPSTLASNRPRNGFASTPRLWIFRITGGASSPRTPEALSSRISAALYARSPSTPSMRSGRSTVTFQKPNASLSKILLSSVSSKARKASQMRRMSSSPSSQFFLPRFLRSGWNHFVAVDEPDLAPPVRGLPVRQHPDVGGDAGVVEHVERQGDDGFQPVVLDDPTPDVALALAGVAGEQGTAVVDLGDSAAERRVSASSWRVCWPGRASARRCCG